MDKFKVAAFLEEFPFVGNIKLGEDWVPGESCELGNCGEYRRDVFPPSHIHSSFLRKEAVERVEVRRISPEFLKTRPWYNGGKGSLIDINDEERIFLLDGDGNALLEIRQSVDIYRPCADGSHYEEETVGEALLRMKNPEDAVMYAAYIRTGYYVRNHQSIGGCEVILYKAPKGFTLKGWVEEQERRAKAQVEAMVAEIDAKV